MKFKVHIIKDAEDDLDEIFQYVAHSDSLSRAEKLLDKLEETCISLGEFAKRGRVPPELKRVAVFDYLEILYKPYRIIYQISPDRVYVHCVLDGRRELEELLRNRLLR